MKNIDPSKLCMSCMTERENGEGPCPVCGFIEENYQPAPHHLPCRCILNGKYLTGRVIGEGGFGITYLGWDLNLDMKVAIKEYYPSGFVTREATASNTVMTYMGDKSEAYHRGKDHFLQEAKVLAKFFSLPGIVSVKDFFLENNTAYIVMEYLEGMTLKQYLQRQGGKLPAEELFSRMRPVMQSLEQVHRAGLMHRDISPDNIMLTNSGQMKLLDFGAARDISADGQKSLSVLLKPGYAPEEQYRTHGEQGPWTDVYALCATMYKCLTGETPEESLERLGEDSLVPPSGRGADTTPAQDAALMQGLAVKAPARFRSMEALEKSLYRTTPLDPPIPPTPPQPPMPPVPTPPIPQDTPTVPLEPGMEENATVPLETEPVNPFQPAAPEKRKFLAWLIGLEPKKKGLLAGGVVVLLTLLVVLFVCLAPKETPYALTYGTTPENLINGGLAAKETVNGKEIFYYAGVNGGIYTCEKGSYGEEEVERLTENEIDYLSALFLQIIDENIYYFNIEDGLIHRMTKTGKDNRAVMDIRVSFFAAYEDDLYYVDYENGYLHRASISGKNAETISEKETSFFLPLDGWLYTLEREDQYGNVSEEEIPPGGGGYLFRMKPDGSKREQLLTVPVGRCTVRDDWIYYICGEEGALKKVHMNGTKEQTLVDAGVYTFNIADGRIYYRSTEEDRGLYRMDTSGKNQARIGADATDAIAILGEDVIYYGKEKDKQAYHMYLTNTKESGTYIQRYLLPEKENVSLSGGTTQANLLNTGRVATAQNKLYYFGLNGGLYSGDSGNPNAALKVSTVSGTRMQLWDDTIYYLAQDDAIHRMALDGTEDESLSIEASYFTIVNGQLFYTDMDDAFWLSNVDGTGAKLFCDQKVYLFLIQDGWIYTLEPKDENGKESEDYYYLFRMKADGSQREQLLEDTCDFPIAVRGDWLYYLSAADKELYRTHLDGTGAEGLGVDDLFTFNLTEDWIYYSTLQADGGLYRIGLDGGTPEQVTSGDIYWIYTIGSDIVFEKENEEGKERELYLVHEQEIGGSETSFYRLKEEADSEPAPSSSSSNEGGSLLDRFGFEYPSAWSISKNTSGSPYYVITGIQGGVQYQLEVLDITDDTSQDIFDYTLSKIPEQPTSGGMGSVGSAEIGNYSGVSTGCFYLDEDGKRCTLDLYCITDGTIRVVFATRNFNPDSSQYDPQVYQKIIDSMVLRS